MTVLSWKEGEISTGSLEGRFESGIFDVEDSVQEPSIFAGFSISEASSEKRVTSGSAFEPDTAFPTSTVFRAGISPWNGRASCLAINGEQHRPPAPETHPALGS